MSRERPGFGSGSTVSRGNSQNRGQNAVEQARDMLIGAVDRVIQLATNQGGPTSQSTHSNDVPAQSVSANVGVSLTQSNASVSRTSDDDGRGSAVTTIEEHRRLFGYRRATTGHNFEPTKATAVTQVRGRRGKGKGRLMLGGARRLGRSSWRKSCICLKNMHQSCKPSATEKMELAKIGLGLAELKLQL